MSRDMTIVALERFWSNKRWPKGQNENSVADVNYGVASRTRQRRRITASTRAEVVEHYGAGMSCRRVADTLGLGRTTVLTILKDAGVDIRPQGQKY
jgi:hypothetical protein